MEGNDLENNQQEKKSLSYYKLFRFARLTDWCLMIVSALCALTHGSLFPLFVIFFGDVIDQFGAVNGDFVDAVTDAAYSILYVSAAAFVLSYLQVMCSATSAQRQSVRIRTLYFTSLCRQEMAWYDTHSTAALSSRVINDVPKIQEGMGDKAASFLQYLGMFVAGFVVGFIYGWKLTLVITAIMPLIIAGGALMSKFIGQATSGGTAFYADAGAVADEVLRMIRTVVAFGTQEQEVKRYDDELKKACRAGERAGRAQGLGMGFTMFVVFASYAVTFLYGSKLVRDGEMSAGDVITVYFSVMIGAMSIGQASPHISAMAAAQGAASHIFEVIDRQSQIDSLKESGETPSKVNGVISLRDIHFSYPSRPDEKILRGLNLDIQAQETVALVGHSGCGKSTIMSLLERFYDPSEGQVKLDGRDIRDLNPQWLHDRVGLVEQTPVLFPTTIYENIALGLEGCTKEQIIQAAKQANAHDFIQSFPDQYETMVGDNGVQMSGGQRQRIAIARALIKNPDILLLDEATSALDNESESIVKDALDKASKNRTTIMIAHRLSTVLDCDRIIFIDKGQVLESGPPQELLDRQGAFAQMVAVQQGQETTGMKLARKSNAEATFNEMNTDNCVISTTNSDHADEVPPSPKKAAKTSVGLGADAELAEELQKRYAEETPEVNESMLKWTYSMSKNETCYLFWGVIGAIGEGVVWPVYTILLADVLSEMLGRNDADIVLYWSLGFIAVAVAMFFSQLLKLWFLTVAGERLTKRLRKLAFRAMVLKDISWHDQPQHERGILTSRLASEAHAVRGILGERLGVVFATISTLIASLAIALGFCWRVGLVVLACTPALLLGGYFEYKLVVGFASGKGFELSGKFASQTVEHMRTVVSLGRLENFVRDYQSTLIAPSKKMRKSAQIQGVAYGFTEFSFFAMWSLAFWYGATVIEDGQCSFDDMFKAIMAIVFMGFNVGQLVSLAPNAAKANNSAKRLYHLITSTDESDEGQVKAIAKTQPQILGQIEFQDVQFTYPTRPDAPVLQGMSFRIEPGKTLALVGQSGCGKSTSISLLEKFYDIDGGKILIDGNDISLMDDSHLRKHIALVTQQPDLFARSISDNIAYGLDCQPTQDEIDIAAQQANAFDFIHGFEKGFETLVGEKGAQLSGGQRQRIAIARALVRSNDIKILLLDEASAALDSQSEELVHEALEKAQEGRTTIVIAHRLSTVRHADTIAVVDQGKIIEQGSHDELMLLQGAYFNLVNKQDLFADDDLGEPINVAQKKHGIESEFSADEPSQESSQDHENDCHSVQLDVQYSVV